jgi:hypothetical protein
MRLASESEEIGAISSQDSIKPLPRDRLLHAHVCLAGMTAI